MPELTTAHDRALQLQNILATALGREPADGLAPWRVQAWLEVEKFILRSHVCKSVWRPVIRDEIKAGWAIRSRDVVDGSEMSLGVAHHQNSAGDWFTKSGALLTYAAAGWILETVEPKPEPEPEPEPRVALVLKWAEDSEGVTVHPDAARELLALLSALPEENQS